MTYQKRLIIVVLVVYVQWMVGYAAAFLPKNLNVLAVCSAFPAFFLAIKFFPPRNIDDK